LIAGLYGRNGVVSILLSLSRSVSVPLATEWKGTKEKQQLTRSIPPNLIITHRQRPHTRQGQIRRSISDIKPRHLRHNVRRDSALCRAEAGIACPGRVLDLVEADARGRGGGGGQLPVQLHVPAGDGDQDVRAAVGVAPADVVWVGAEVARDCVGDVLGAGAGDGGDGGAAWGGVSLSV